VTSKTFYSVSQARDLAQRVLPKVIFDYIEGGADEEITMLNNRKAFQKIFFKPKMVQGSFTPELETELLGFKLSMPILLAPCGLVKIMNPDGALGAVKAAERFQTISVLSAVAGTSLEDVTQDLKSNNLWFQLYASKGQEEIKQLIDRAYQANVSALVVTVDTPELGNRLRDAINGVKPPININLRNASKLLYQILSKPKWTYGALSDFVKMRKNPSSGFMAKDMLKMAASPFSWDDIKLIKNSWDKYLIIKGVLTKEDAQRAVDNGADGIVVSNHGGRQLEGAPPTIEVISEIADQVSKSVPVILDSGIRTGTDVIKALCLGASAVMIGRPYLYGLSVAGEKGIERILEIFKQELITDMVLLGCKSVKELDKSWLFLRDK
jgi:L-lactate dehydrogenase (cytochrome)